MRWVLLLCVWAALSLPACGSGSGAGIHIDQGCRVACCGCNTDEDCDPPRRCWPVTVNDTTYHVCEASNEICLPTGSLAKRATRITRLSFLPRFLSQTLDLSSGVSTPSAPAPAEGDLQLTERGSLDCRFARTWDPRPSAILALGPVGSLSEIREAPLDGYGASAPVVLGHGYVVRCQEYTYARCRVREPIVESDGTLVGWILEWSYQADGSRTFEP